MNADLTTFRFFGGKGGVGKTTCAAAYALSVVGRDPEASVLLVSTDPAHSLGDALGVRLSARVRAVRPRLDAVELDAPRAFARWMAERHAAAADVLEHGTRLDRDDIDALLALPIPGIDELIGLIEIDRLARHGDAAERRRLVVIDTAPTGHTLRLLAAPDAVRAVAGLLDAMQAEHRVIREQLARVGRPEAADRLIDEMANEASGIAIGLRNRVRTKFSWVTLPEPMSIAESRDALEALDRIGIRVDEIIVNRLLTDEGPCAICDRRRADERVALASIRRTLGRSRRLRLVAAAPSEPRGLAALTSLAQTIADAPAHRLRMRTGNATRRARATQARHVDTDVTSFPVVCGARLIFVAGKGGVGKTTVAAALAVSLARADEKRRVLLLSTDPAHSLADVFASAVGDRPVAVAAGPPNLSVREVDAAAALSARRRDVDAALGDIAASLGADAAGRTAGDLMDLAPPGVDELFGLLSVFEAQADYDAIVVDMAPTGHALRLLELPETAREWVQVLLRVLLKYRSLVRPGRLAAELVEVSRSIRAFQAMLRDARVTRVLVVTRAAHLPRRESGRLIGTLTKLRLAVPAVVVNALTLEGEVCRRCRRIRAAERREVDALRRAVGRRSIIRTPLVAPSPRGAVALASWARRWLA